MDNEKEAFDSFITQVLGTSFHLKRFIGTKKVREHQHLDYIIESQQEQVYCLELSSQPRKYFKNIPRAFVRPDSYHEWSAELPKNGHSNASTMQYYHLEIATPYQVSPASLIGEFDEQRAFFTDVCSIQDAQLICGDQILRITYSDISGDDITVIVDYINYVPKTIRVDRLATIKYLIKEEQCSIPKARRIYQQDVDGFRLIPESEYRYSLFKIANPYDKRGIGFFDRAMLHDIRVLPLEDIIGYDINTAIYSFQGHQYIVDADQLNKVAERISLVPKG